MKITMEMFFLFALGLNVAFLGSVRKHLSFSNENIFVCVCVISVKLFIEIRFLYFWAVVTLLNWFRSPIVHAWSYCDGVNSPSPSPPHVYLAPKEASLGKRCYPSERQRKLLNFCLSIIQPSDFPLGCSTTDYKEPGGELSHEKVQHVYKTRTIALAGSLLLFRLWTKRKNFDPNKYHHQSS